MDITTVSQLDEGELRQVIATVLKFPNVRKADQSALVGSEPFITVKNISTVQIGSPTYYFIGEKEQELITSTDQTTYSIQAFGKNANALLKTLRTALYSSKAISELRKMKCALVEMSQPRDISAIAGAGMEERCQLDLIINHNHRVAVTQERIERVTVKANAGPLENQVTITENS